MLAEPADLDLSEIEGLQESGAMNAVALTRYYLRRIEQFDPVLKSVLTINPDAERIAEQRDLERSAGKKRGALHGLPILVKDNIDTGDRMATTAGSLALADSRPGADAFVVARLRAAGAIILGKTNLSEWANFRSPHSTTGWSSVGGQTVNAYDITRTPGGSSSGSGVAVAAGFAAAALGTETDGSVVIPSAMNCLVGIKPTLGRVSRTGIVPIAHSQDTAGPMAGTVMDAYRLLTVMTGADPQDPVTADLAPLKPVSEINAGALRGKRIGVVAEYCRHNPKVMTAFDQTLWVLRDQGVEVIDEVSLFDPVAMERLDIELMLCEFKTDLDSYLERLPATSKVHSMREVVEFNELNAERVMPFFGQEWMLRALEKTDPCGPAYREVLAEVKRQTGPDGIDAALSRYRLDALVAPTIGTAWKIDPVNGDHRSLCASTPAALSGYPSVSVPAGFVEGLPIGVLFFGARCRDFELIELAYDFEQATRVRRPPSLGVENMNAQS